MTAPCYLCGKPSVLEGLCADCFNDGHPLIEVSTPLTLLACKKCGSIKLAEGWRKIAGDGVHPDDFGDYQIELLLDRSVKILGRDVQISLEDERKLDRVTHTIMTVTGRSHESLAPHEEKYNVEIRFRYGTCETCGMMSGGYYEAILQVRADGRELTDEEKTMLTQTVTDITVARYKSDDKAFITSTLEDKYGIDFYIGSENLCKYIADEFELEYLAERKDNYKLVGEEKGGKRKYRITILIRLPRFAVGDFVKIGDNPCEVVAMSRNMLTCYDLKQRERFSINPRSARWRTLEFLAPQSSRREFMVTTYSYGQPVQIMDATSFEVLEVEQSIFESDIAVGDKIYALQLEEKLYILSEHKQFNE
ncbi:MAG: 60S ribosomal export protein NMD3 [Candidatus Thorarchaeota archaeon]